MFTVLCIVGVSTARVCFAAPPTITGLFPAGGQRGTTVEVTATGTFDTWPTHVWASDKAVSVQAGKTKGAWAVTVGADAAPGTCWVRAYDDSGASQLRPFVIGTLPEVLEIEPNDTPANPQSVTLPAVVNGKLGKTGDVDCFAVTLKKGATLVASVEANHTLRSPMDGILQITSPDGTVLEQNHDHRGLDPQVVFTAPMGGSFLVRLFAFPSQPDSSIRHFGSEACVYRLMLTTGGVVDFVTPLAVERGREATLTYHGWNLREKQSSLPGSDVQVFPKWSATGGQVRREPHPCYDFTTSKSDGPLTPPFTVSGRLNQTGEPSAVSIIGVKGKPLAIRLDAASLGLPLTPVLRIVETTKKQLAKVEPASLNGDLETTFTPPADGVYHFQVSDLYANSGPRFVYRLRVVAVGPSFEPTVTTDRLTITAGQPLDVPVTVGPKDGFAGELDWSIDGLPDAVTFRLAPPAGKPNPNVATLRFESKMTGFNGPIRVTATPKVNPKTPYTVSAKLTGFDTTTTDFWLTVVASATKK